MGRVQGKVVVVTGAAGGQGAAEARALVAEGATVIATDLHDEAADLPAEVVYRRLDVARPEDWESLETWIGAQGGRLDGLVNNAGIPFRARLDEIELRDWDRVLAVNLTGTLLGVQFASRLMTAGGSIVNVSSVAGLTSHYAVSYAVSKWGVRGLSRVASMELGPRGIRVNTIFPGYVETAMTASAPAAFRAANIAGASLGRVGQPDEIAPLVVYLLSDESSFVSGAEIAIDGGLTSHGGAKALSDAVHSPVVDPELPAPL